MQPCIVALDGIAEADLYLNRTHLVAGVGMAGAMIAWLKEQGVHYIVMTGALRRPDWSKLKVDARGMKILAKILLKKTLGDDQLLRTLRRELEADGFELKGIQDYVPDLLAPTGLLTTINPLDEDNESIRLGFNAAKELGRQDKGQSVVVQQEAVIGLEGPDGTKALMLKAAQIKSAGRGPILVKVCKPQQDKALDMPTIGLQTIMTAIDCGYVGIVVEAGETLLVDRDEVIDLCNQKNIFLLSIKADQLP